MGLDISTGYCKYCKEQRKFERKATNHVLHLLITVVLGILTFPFFAIGGIFWLVIWILSAIKIGGWRCSVCGSGKSTANQSIIIQSLKAVGILVIIMYITTLFSDAK